MIWTRAALISVISIGVCVRTALAASCYATATVNCCDLSAYTPNCQNCTNHPNCCDTMTGAGGIFHHVPAGSGNPGNQSTTAGASCNCKIQQKICSGAGYCVDFGAPVDQRQTPYTPAGAGCTGGA